MSHVQLLSDVERFLRLLSDATNPQRVPCALRKGAAALSDRVFAAIVRTEWHDRPAALPDGSRAGVAREARAGAAPLVEPPRLDWSRARLLCDCGHVFAFDEARQLTSWVACPRCCNPDARVRVQNLNRALHSHLVGGAL